jgi:hypothetical protein
MLSRLRPEMIEQAPGQLNDRRTMLGQLNWIFTAITDTIAWNVRVTPCPISTAPLHTATTPPTYIVTFDQGIHFYSFLFTTESPPP